MTAGAGPAPEPARGGSRSRRWGNAWRQRLRLAPLAVALGLADRLAPLMPAHPARVPLPWREGISVVIPERDAPEMLGETLAALVAALARIGEPSQVIVAVNGAPREAYAELEQRHPEVEWTWSEAPLAFVAAIEQGLRQARYDWTYLLNNDMLLDAEALRELLPLRADGVFAIASQIFQRSASGRREETGFVDWYADRDGIHVHHAPVPNNPEVVPQLAASGGAALFRTEVLRDYLPGSRCYHPFYWEDIEWGVRAWRDGLAVLFAPRSRATHRHRATTARFHAAAEIDRIVERNRLLFDARHRAAPDGASALLARICDQPYASQRELAHLGIALGVFGARLSAARAPQPLPPPVLSTRSRESSTLRESGYAFRLLAATEGRRPRRPRLLLVTPFAVFPPRHGGARRIAAMLDALKRDFDVILLTDEAGLYDGRSLAGFDGLYAVHLVQRDQDARAASDTTLEARSRTHCHPRFVTALEQILDACQPALVQVEYAELAPLIRSKRPSQRWILDLHDACGPDDFGTAAAAAGFERDTLPRYDAVTVCSDEDRALVRHPNVIAVPNGSAIPLGNYRPSTGTELLFVGPFRYPPNLAGVLAFVREAYPAIRAAQPTVTLRVLGGDGAPELARRYPELGAPDILVEGHRDDVALALNQCALTVNPLTGIRGSALKLIESLSAGRVCVSTMDGARGFGVAGLHGLVVASGIAAMAEPIITLLADAGFRHEREAPDAAILGPHQWQHCLAPHRSLCARLLGLPGGGDD